MPTQEEIRKIGDKVAQTVHLNFTAEERGVAPKDRIFISDVATEEICKMLKLQVESVSCFKEK